MIFDEVRLGATWASVVPQGATAVLSIQKVSPTQVRLSWPAALSGYTLQSSTNISSGWTAAALIESTQGDERIATDTITGTARFYRLAQ